jgi:hypothetical protein
VKTAAIYMRVSTVDQHTETQMHDLRAMAEQRGLQIVREYSDRISGTKRRRPGRFALQPSDCQFGCRLAQPRDLSTATAQRRDKSPPKTGSENPLNQGPRTPPLAVRKPVGRRTAATSESH